MADDLAFNPENVNLTDASDDLIREVTCYFQLGDNEYNGSLGTSFQVCWRHQQFFDVGLLQVLVFRRFS